MAHIPDTEIKRLKAEVSVERLVEASGIELKRGGKDLLGRCPFHEDDTASLVATPGKNRVEAPGPGASEVQPGTHPLRTKSTNRRCAT